MSGLYLCAGSCLVLSIWAIVQLVIMSVCYYFEAPTLIEDVAPSEGTYRDYNDFIDQVKQNYAFQSRNCFIVAGIYVLTLILSYLGLKRAKKKDKIKAVQREDDEVFCSQHADKIIS